MNMTTTDSAITLAREEAPAERTSPLEQEVVDLFDRLRARLLRYVLGFGLPMQDAEEIVQEVFLSLFRHLQRGKSRENLPGWVFRVAHNLALKRRASLNLEGSIAGNSVRSGFAQEADVCADPAPNPEDQMASHQTQRRLLAVLRALPEQDRRCLALRAEGLRYRDIGHVLGVSLGAVAQSLSRSLARLTNASER